MPVVQMPDGTFVDLPDNPTPEQAQQLQSLLQPAPVQQPTPPQAGLPSGAGILNMMKQGGAGLIEGLTSLPRLLAEGGAAFQSTQSAFGSRRKNDDFNAMSRDLKKALPEPKTDAEKYTRSVGEGVGGMAMGAGGLMQKLGLGVLSGVGAEVGERVGGAPGRAVGGAVGAVGPGVVGGVFRGNTADLAKKGIEGISDQELAQAITKMRNAELAGTKLTLGQALGRPTNIDSLEEALANSDLGPRVQKILNQQPEQLAGMGKAAVDKLPGEVVQPNNAANAMQDAATAAVDAAKKYRTARVERFYEDGGEIPADMIPAWQKIIREKAAKNPNTALGDALNTLADRLVVKGAKRTPEGINGAPIVNAQGKPITLQNDTPITDLKQFNEVLKNVYRDIKAPGLNKAPIDARTDGELRRTLDSLRDDLGVLFPKYKAGNELYRNLSETVVDPLKKSTTGQIAGRTGAVDDRAAARTLADSIFKQGTTPGGKSNILSTERDMRIAGKQQEFLAAAKSHLVRQMAELSAIGPGGGTTPDLARNVTKLYGNQVQKQGLDDTLVAIARAQGLRDTDLLPGFRNFLQIAAAQAKRPNRIQGMNPNEIASEASENLPATFARVFSFMPAEKMARKIDRGYQERAYTALDEMLTTPEGVKKLQELAKLPVMSQKAKAIVNGFLGGMQGTDESR